MKFLIRADASRESGIGHLMRTYALAQTFIDLGNEVSYLSLEIPATMENLLDRDNIEIVRFYTKLIGSNQDAEITADIARALKVDWVIADGYSFDSEYQDVIKKQGLRLMVIDDYGHADFYRSDIILNPGINPHPDLYRKKDDNVQLLLGPEHISLRREFLKTSGCPKEIVPLGKRVLVTMGGSDPVQATWKVVDSLRDLTAKLEITVVTGSLYPYTKRLEAAIRGSENILLLHNSDDMAALMDWADIGITAGGTTLSEMAYMGLPNIIIQTADNQSSSKYYELFGTSIYLGDAELISRNQIQNSVDLLIADSSRRQMMSETGRKLIDGKGNKRVYDALLKHSSS